MLTCKRKESAFTLIELLFVVVIVGVLAAVATPLFGGQVNKARLSEGIAGLGTVRTAMRAEQAEAGKFPAIVLNTKAVAANIGVATGDLLGRYFDDPDYSFTVASTDTTFCVGVNGNSAGSAAIQRAKVTGLTRSMNELGNLFKSADCTGAVVNQ